MYVIGIDCGATHLRVGIVDQDGKIVGFEKSHSPLQTEPKEFGIKIKELSKKLFEETHFVESEITAIGVGVPGPIDFEKGMILISSNLHNTEPINFKHQIESVFSSNVYIDRDTDIALRGEVWKGAGMDSKNVVMLTLGTGVGGAIMIDGKLQHGTSGMAGEIGHMLLQVNDDDTTLPVCGLGHRGCLEGFIKNSKDLEHLSQYLGLGLANIVDILNPQKIIIGGGMIMQGDFLPEAIRVMKEKGVKPPVNEVIVEYSKLGDLAGVVGAGKLAFDGHDDGN
jgi:glucokinase